MRIFTFSFLIFYSCCSIASVFDKSDVNVLVIGNSITRHRPSASIKWNNNWGMAASNIESDYVHLSKQALESRGLIVHLDIVSGAALEKGLESIDGVLERIKSKKYDLLIVQLGDNSGGRQGFYQDYIGILRFIKTNNENSMLRCIGVWWSKPKLDDDLRGACEEFGGVYLSLLDFSYQDHYRGWLNFPDLSRAVKEHPGDLGMKIISERLIESIFQGL